jgi:hypothetical protein
VFLTETAASSSVIGVPFSSINLPEMDPTAPCAKVGSADTRTQLKNNRALMIAVFMVPLPAFQSVVHHPPKR